MLWKRGRKRPIEIEPDEIFIDSSNIPSFDREQFEGRIERPISTQSLFVLGILIALLFGGYGVRAFNLMVVQGAAYAKQAAENQLSESIVFADRGIISDRTGIELAFNQSLSTTSDYAERVYAPFRGIAHVVGYVKPPRKDSSGIYYQTSHEGVDGAEKVFDELLKGENGRVLTEVNARGELVSQSTVDQPESGRSVRLSIDAKVAEGFFDAIAARVEGSKFQGGAGVILDVESGEILALASYPEFPLQEVSEGNAEVLEQLTLDTREPFLDRAVDGLYAPGSIIKPILAAAALQEGLIEEYTQILSTGSITIPNPYNPSQPSVYRDWRAHGLVDMRKALAVSSDVYFYAIGGGYGAQRGLGITLLEEYYRMFGFGTDAGLQGYSSKTGTVPNPAWKEATFDGDPWRLGNTYHTSIGQYGMQVTPLQAARAIAAIANGGELVRPTLLASSTPVKIILPVGAHPLQVAREGMRQAVKEGTAAAVNLPFVEIAAKTGTAEVGVRKEFINSWMVGFFPYQNPRFAYAVVMERAPAGTLMGAPAAMYEFFRWLNTNAPQYLQ